MTSLPTPAPRLFLALWPPADIAAAFQERSDAWAWTEGARRTRPERLHITLHFIGEVPATELPALQDVLEVPWPGCDLLLDRAEVWPGGIAVLEAGTVPPPLRELHAALGERLRSAGRRVETRPYRPHVTFARHAQGSRPPVPWPPLAWPAGPGYVLVQSLPGGRGYQPLQRFG